MECFDGRVLDLKLELVETGDDGLEDGFVDGGGGGLFGGGELLVELDFGFDAFFESLVFEDDLAVDVQGL